MTVEIPAVSFEVPAWALWASAVLAYVLIGFLLAMAAVALGRRVAPYADEEHLGPLAFLMLTLWPVAVWLLPLILGVVGLAKLAVHIAAGERELP